MSDDTATSEDRLAARLNPVSLPLRHQLGLITLVLMAVAPLGFDQLFLLKLTGALYFAMFAMSWDAVSGYTGQISFGHGLFFAVGGYTSALLNMGHGIPTFLSIPAGILLAVVASIVIGVPALRLEGPYLSLVTLVAPLILLQLFIMFSGIFGGELGISAPESLVGFDPMANYYLAFGVFLFVLLVLLAVTRSDAGSVLTAIREDEEAVAAAGLNPAKFKIFAFVLSGAVGGLAGAFYVHTPVGQPTPSELFTVLINVEVIIAAILGGMGTIVGAAIGGMFIVLFNNFLSNVEMTVPLANATIGEMSFFIFVLITLALLFVFPGGLIRWAIGLGDKALHSAGLRSETAADGGRTPVEQTIEKYRGYYEELFGGDRE